MEKPTRIFYEGETYIIEDVSPKKEIKAMGHNMKDLKIEAIRRVFGSLIMMFAGYKVVSSAFHATGLGKWLTFIIGLGLGAYGVYLIRPYIPTIVKAVRRMVRKR
jgi:hypothetical protein